MHELVNIFNLIHVYMYKQVWCCHINFTAIAIWSCVMWHLSFSSSCYGFSVRQNIDSLRFSHGPNFIPDPKTFYRIWVDRTKHRRLKNVMSNLFPLEYVTKWNVFHDKRNSRTKGHQWRILSIIYFYWFLKRLLTRPTYVPTCCILSWDRPVLVLVCVIRLNQKSFLVSNCIFNNIKINKIH